jgi:hypothetical protein
MRKEKEMGGWRREEGMCNKEGRRDVGMVGE